MGLCETICENSGRERTTAFVYAVGWTQHTVGSQYIRTACILQLLLGNIGRPGGGIMAMRGHASIQGSSDIPTLFDLLPGYLPMPHAHEYENLQEYIESDSAEKGYWGNMSTYVISLLKAWWGDAATAENDWCFDYMPRITGSHGTYDTVMAQLEGKCKGYFLMGQNPAVGSANNRMQRTAMANLEWLVVRDFSLIESATWWKDGPEIDTGEMRTEEIATEVFFFPAAAHIEKDGTFTNTQRLLQWHHKAQEPKGDARSDLWFMFHLGKLIREKLAGSTEEMDRPILDLTWDYPTAGPLDEPSAEAVLREINGHGADGQPLSSYEQLRDDGSTTCGCWIYCGVFADGVNQSARRTPREQQNWTGAEWGWAWPANRRVLYNRASADPDGKPWSERKALVWWDSEQGRWVGHDTPDFKADKAPTYVPPKDAKGPEALSGSEPFIMQGDGRGWLYAPAGLADGPLPTHYEPQDSPVRERALQPARQPRAQDLPPPQQPLPPQRRRKGRGRVPLCRHHLPPHRALHRRRHDPLVALPRRATARVLLRGLTRARRRAPARARRLGDDRHRPRRDRGARARHRAHDPAPGPRPHRPPDRHALPLGPQRLRQRRLRQRALADVARAQRPHPGGQGVHRRYQARPSPPRPRTPGARRGVQAARGCHRWHWGKAVSEVSLLSSVRGHGDPAADVYEEHPPRMGFFTDTSLCIGCKACEVACKEWNQVPEDGLNFTGMSFDNSEGLSADTWRHVAFIEQAATEHPATDEPGSEFRWLMSSDVCKHCTDAACLDVCPTGALFRTEFGTVVVQEDVCNGCGYCVPACPYGVIGKREGDGRVWKCTLCYDRLGEGMEPACAKACPTNSIQFGELDELRVRAAGRVEQLQRAGVLDVQLYGHDPDDGVGGDGAFFLLLDEPEVYGLPPHPVATTRDLPRMWRNAAIAAAGLLGAVGASFAGRR